MKRLIFSLAVLAATSVSTQAIAGALIVSGDEWQLTNNAYAIDNTNTSTLAAAIAGEFGGSNYLLLTGNATWVPQSNLSSLASQLTGLGKSVSYSASLPGNLASYDAVLHFGQPYGSPATSLGFGSYLAGGGSLYVSLGGGYYGSAAGEANFWNPFLNGYGLNAGSGWGPAPFFTGATVTSGPAGLNTLVWGYGQTIDVSGPGGASYIRGTFPQFNGQTEFGLMGIARFGGNNGVPEPATWTTMILGFGLAGSAARRRSRKMALQAH
jgi:hypothetical protein